MARCDLCKQFDDCAFRSDPDVICSEFRQKPMTNADKVRQMNDEELAEMFDLLTRTRPDTKDDKRNWLDWLKLEAKDGQS